jgi:hypothetical protein
VSLNDAAVLDGWADVIDDVLDAYLAWVDETKWQPKDDSPQQYELACMKQQFGPAGDWDGSDAQNALGLGSMFLSLSTQHLEGVVALVRARQIIVPLAPIVRSLFEACCRVAWMLEPLKPRPHLIAPLPIRLRAARVTAIRLEDLSRAKAVAVSLGARQAPKWGAEVRKLRQTTIPGMFYPSEISLQPDGSIVICEQRLPGLREGALAYEKTFGVDWKAGGAYDYLSNASHPTPTTVLELTVPEAIGTRRFGIGNPSYPSRLCRLAAVSVLHTWNLMAQYIDTPASAVQPLLDRIDRLPEG